jgi:hypothetical protein
MKENFDKLPQWAKLRIKCLEAEVEYLNKKIEQIGGKKETKIYMRKGIDKHIFLPDDFAICFMVNKSPISIIYRGSNIELQGYQPLHILPKASNSIEIAQE